MIARRLTLAGLASLCALAVMLVALFAVAPAWASRGRVFSRSFGAPGSGAGQLSLLPGTDEPGSGVAVNESTHDVYVADTGNDRVAEFNEDGEFVLVFGGAVNRTAVEGHGSEAEQDVCTAASGDVCQAGTGGSSPGELQAPTFVAVDESLGGEGGVYVADAEGVQRFSAQGALDSAWGVGGRVARTPVLASGTAETVAGSRDVSLTASTGAFETGMTLIGEGVEGDFIQERLANGSFGLERPATVTGTVHVEGYVRLDRPAGLGVDPEGHLRLRTGNGVFEFESTGAFDKYVPSNARAVTVFDAMGDYYHEGNGAGSQVVLEKFGSEGQALGEVFTLGPSGHQATGLALGGAGELFVDENGGVVKVLSPACDFPPSSSCSVLESFGSEQLKSGVGVGVDTGTGAVYVADAATNVVDEYVVEPLAKPTVAGESVSGVTAESAVLSGEVDPRSEGGPDTEYHFEYGACSSPGACATSAYEHSTPVASLPPDFNVHTVSATIEGLRAGALYHFRVVASNSLGTAEGESSGGGGEVARTFTAQGVGVFGLPDGRAWELVSPPDKHGALIETIGAGHVTQAAADGGAIAYAADAPTEAAPQGYSGVVQLLSRRDAAAGGWESSDLSPPLTAASGVAAAEGEYTFFSSDLSQGILQPYGVFVPCESEGVRQPCLSPEATEQTPFLHTNLQGGGSGGPCVESCYQPLVTGASGYANVPPGTPFGAQGECPKELLCGPLFRGATADLSHVVLESHVALTKVPLPPLVGQNPDGLYEWSAGAPPGEQLKLVSALPGKGEVAANGLPQLGSENRIARNAVSADGSRVVWSEKEGENHLYLRDMGRAETVRLDAPEPGCVAKGGCEESGLPRFQVASSDGSRVFFTDDQRLTVDSGATTQGRDDLYVCEVVLGEHGLECRLTDLTPQHGEESADVQDEVIGASEDGTYVYFVANGRLSEGEGAVRGTCGEAIASASRFCYLYVAHFDGSRWETRVVAVLSDADFPDWNGVGTTFHLQHVTARVSPDGRWLAFMSQRDLTGYDTRDARTGGPDEEVYLYHAQTSGSGALQRGELMCASCDPTGARPLGVPFDGMQYGADGGTNTWEGSVLAGSVPSWTSYSVDSEALYQPRYLSDGGRLFFNSPDALVPVDVNGTGDVYEYEPEGVGSESAQCGPGSDSGSVVFKPAHEYEVEGRKGEEPAGCVGLISSGSSAEESMFLDASETGGDVFFRTKAQLVSQDMDSAYDVYDAHECTSAAPCFSAGVSVPPPCATADACRAAPSPQPAIFGAPASATFAGQGNVSSVSPPVAKAKAKPKPKPKKPRRCGRPGKLRHGRCVRSRAKTSERRVG